MDELFGHEKWLTDGLNCIGGLVKPERIQICVS